MNVSGLNIDVGNPKAPASSTWSIPNISITPIPPNPTNTQTHVYQGPEGTPQISSNANPESKFPCEFLLNPGRHPVASQDPFGKMENVTWSGLSEGNQGLTLHQNMAPKGKSVRSQEQIEDYDELYASSPLVHKEKATERQHPYASKPRPAHASSSREKMVDDEDENMSPTQMETNDEPRRDNFMGNEHGTQSNNEFTHPQMPLAQSMLEQSEVRKKRNQALKAHNKAKRASQKEQQKWLKAELPENVHGMRSAVHPHCLFLLK
ncbi:hypothetical protein O181_133360, partial [Austropuccinia psidii MF-1]|nr:hypothetical protein [Austropuccinia psidii MF-1]